MEAAGLGVGDWVGLAVGSGEELAAADWVVEAMVKAAKGK